MGNFLIRSGRFLANKTVLASIFFLIALVILCLPALVNNWVGTAEKRAALAQRSVDEATRQIHSLREKK